MPDAKPLLIVVGGPTASGKTGLAIDLARHFSTEIISGDSRQFYREMRIGNARPSEEELAAVPHHFVADRSITEPLTAGRFAEEALARLADIHARHRVAVLVGGSGLYLRALCAGLDEFPEVTEAARTQVQRLYESAGLPALQQRLAELDPAYFAEVDRQNPRRLIRALEVSLSAGKAYSSFRGQQKPRPFQPLYLKLHPDREVLYARINQRVDEMLAEGLEAEAQRLRDYRHLPVMQTVGYQEWWPYFDGEYDRSTAVELIKRNSRRYAKRQVTWFGKGETYRAVSNLEDALRIVGVHWS
ncbi:tRNA (adenosine(37)-N6)-dimethylallyltransferase MiaA [Lewinella sp. W8]|uniref:tRNA (adenosine(37)-N6)-dimethylallyltransferase MiaA n=1 Tax=Lewinella sp. W8 TaxID=2528208 RepID=UPI001067322D|nr:tRNA (adenosine(37)-N6)-dimethylallyltransferase MiaA [Lewinella sp. W8]MTB50319.1 tRNA (adenosine(37)-N6)-dimethylallyltransferase MiaA [Lewinella sp. W8]